MQQLEYLVMGALPPLDFTFAMGALSVAITLLAYAVLLQQIIWGTKRPSPIAWIGFGLCTGVGYLVQFYAGVNAGSWTMGVTAFFCFIVGGASMLKGGRKTALLDWIALALGLATFGGWLACYLYQLDQTLAAVLATASDLVLYVPLIRAGWSHPELDSRMAYFLNTVKFVPALIITVPFTIATALYPVALVVANSGMNIYLVIRKVYLGAQRKAFEDLWRFLDAEFPFVSSIAIAVVYALTVWVEMKPQFALFTTFAAAGVIFSAIIAMCRVVGDPHQERVDRGEPGLMSPELNRLWVRAYKVVSITSLLDMQIFMALFVPIFIGHDGSTVKSPIILPMMGLMTLGFMGITTLIFAHGEFEGNIWKWLPQKLCSQVALVAGAYTDLFVGHTTAAAVFLSIVLVQLVWTVLTWPHQLAEPKDPDRWYMPNDGTRNEGSYAH